MSVTAVEFALEIEQPRWHKWVVITALFVIGLSVGSVIALQVIASRVRAIPNAPHTSIYNISSSGL